MTLLEQQLFETCRKRNHELVEANRQLYLLIEQLATESRQLRDQYREEKEEQYRYIAELERIIVHHGWNPNDKR